MEVAHPSGPQHKRKLGSALDQAMLDRLHPGSDSGKVAPPSDEEAPEPAEPAAEPAPLTETASTHLLGLRSAQEDLVGQIDEITRAGLELLGGMRRTWLERMEKAKQELARMLDQTEGQLQRDSLDTIDLRKRCAFTSAMVERLGIKVEAREPAAEALFTAEEDGAGAAAPAGADEGEEAAS